MLIAVMQLCASVRLQPAPSFRAFVPSGSFDQQPKPSDLSITVGHTRMQVTDVRPCSAVTDVVIVLDFASTPQELHACVVREARSIMANLGSTAK